MEVFGESGLFHVVLVTLVLWCVVVTGVNLVICEKGRDWFREMMGVKMGGRYVVLPRLVVSDGLQCLFMTIMLSQLKKRFIRQN